MKISRMFPSKYLKAADLDGDTNLTIAKVSVEEVGQDQEEKPAITFVEIDQQLILNKTNATTIEELLGTDETDQWTGKKITLYSTKVEFGGKRVDSIRIRDVIPTEASFADQASDLF